MITQLAYIVVSGAEWYQGRSLTPRLLESVPPQAQGTAFGDPAGSPAHHRIWVRYGKERFKEPSEEFVNSALTGHLMPNNLNFFNL